MKKCKCGCGKELEPNRHGLGRYRIDCGYRINAILNVKKSRAKTKERNNHACDVCGEGVAKYYGKCKSCQTEKKYGWMTYILEENTVSTVDRVMNEIVVYRGGKTPARAHT